MDKVLPWLMMLVVVSRITSCEDPPVRYSAEAFLARRQMANELVEVARAAHQREDSALEAAAYDLLIELWPELPESHRGGAWHDARHAASSRAAYQRSLLSTRNRGISLRERLDDSAQQLDQLTVELQPFVKPAKPEPPVFSPGPVVAGAVLGSVGAVKENVP